MRFRNCISSSYGTTAVGMGNSKNRSLITSSSHIKRSKKCFYSFAWHSALKVAVVDRVENKSASLVVSLGKVLYLLMNQYGKIAIIKLRRSYSNFNIFHQTLLIRIKFTS